MVNGDVKRFTGFRCVQFLLSEEYCTRSSREYTDLLRVNVGVRSIARLDYYSEYYCTVVYVIEV